MKKLFFGTFAAVAFALGAAPAFATDPVSGGNMVQTSPYYAEQADVWGGGYFGGNASTFGNGWSNGSGNITNQLAFQESLASLEGGFGFNVNSCGGECADISAGVWGVGQALQAAGSFISVEGNYAEGGSTAQVSVGGAGDAMVYRSYSNYFGGTD